MMKKIVPLAVLLVGVGGGYKFALAKPPKHQPKPKVDGTVYVLGKEFLVNLADGRFAKLTVALVLDPKDESAAAAEGHAAGKPPEGFGAMMQEAVVRDVITDDLTDSKDAELIDEGEREKLLKKILKDLRKATDVKVEEVIFPDITVQ